MKRGPKPQLFIILTIFVFLLGGAGTYFLFSGNSEKQAEIARLKSEARDTAALETELGELHTQLVNSAEQLAHLEKGIPEIAYIPTMLKELETFGKANGIDVHGVRPVPPPQDKNAQLKSKQKPYNELSIEIKGRGKYRAVMNFIAALKTFPKIVAARTVALQPKLSKAATTGTELDVTIELRAFLFKPEKEELEAAQEDASLSVTPGTADPVKPAEGAAPNSTTNGQAPAQPSTTHQGF